MEAHPGARGTSTAAQGALPPGARLSPPARLSRLLRQLRQGPECVQESLCEELDLLAWHCVQQRRLGCAPSTPAIHAHMQAVANNLPLRRTLKEAASALAAAGVKAIVYKGQDYLERVYGDVGARDMADVDLLVPEQALAAAEAALSGAGFIADPHCTTIHERKFCKDGVAVDLHRALLQPARMRIDHGALFERAVPHRSIPGLQVLEDTDAALVHCIAQAIRAYHLPATSYVELQRLLDDCDSEALLVRAALWKAGSAVYTSLRILGELGHDGAARLARRVKLGGTKRIVLDQVVARFALRTFTLPRPRRATLLALKTTLIDTPTGVAHFVPQWCAIQLGIIRPRAPTRA